MLEATFHDGSTIEIEVAGAGPTLLLPVNPQPVTGPQAETMREWGADPALGHSLIKGLSDAFRVVAFDYEGQVRYVGFFILTFRLSGLLVRYNPCEML